MAGLDARSPVPKRERVAMKITAPNGKVHAGKVHARPTLNPVASTHCECSKHPLRALRVDFENESTQC